MAAKHNWQKIKREYVTGSKTHEELAKKYGVSRSTLSQHSSAEGWREAREEYRTRLEQKTKEKQAEKTAERAAETAADIEAEIQANKEATRKALWRETRRRAETVGDDTEAQDLRRYVQNYADLLAAEPEDKGGDIGGSFELPARVIGQAFCQINRRIVPNRDYIFYGGRGSGKSSYISLKIPELMLNNPLINACIVRKVGNTLKDSVYNQVKWSIAALGLEADFVFKVSPLEMVYKPTGQTIFFRGLDDPLKLKSIKPAMGYIGILWVEEEDQLAGPAEERSVKQSVLRGGAESYFFASYNPPKSRANWVNKRRLEEDVVEGVIFHSSNYLSVDAEWLGQKFLDDAAHIKEINPGAYDHEYLGIPNGDGGLVFEFVEVRTIPNDEAGRFDRIFQGVDWGWYPDQYAFLRCAYDSNRETIYLLDELYVNKTPNEQTAAWIQEHGYDDYLITCDSNEVKSVNDYRDRGLPARAAVKGPGSVEYGFKWLQRRKLVIDPRRTPNAYQEIVNYEYERDKDGDVISGYPDGNDHAISALRYAFEPFFNRRGSSA